MKIPNPRLPTTDLRPPSSSLRPLPRVHGLPTSASSACVALAKQASRPSREPKAVAGCGLRVTRHQPLATPFPNPKSEIRNPKSTLPPPAFHLSPSTPRASREAAFSLTEVVIALGIFAISMVGVLALFPVASATGRESSEETQAAIIAQTVFSDLRSSAANRGAANAWLVSGKNTFTDFVRPINLANPTNIFIAYDIKRRDWADSAEGGAPLIGPPLSLKAMQAVNADAYQAGVPDPANTTYATYTSHLRLQPLAGLNGMALASLEVSTPGGLPRANRRIFTFSTLVTGP